MIQPLRTYSYSGFQHKRMAAYGVAAFAATSISEAEVVHVDARVYETTMEFEAGNGNLAPHEIDLDGDGTTDVEFLLHDHGDGYQEKMVRSGASGGQVFINDRADFVSKLRVKEGDAPARNYAKVFQPGEWIGPRSHQPGSAVLDPLTGTLVQLDDLAGYYVNNVKINRPHPSLKSGAIGFTFKANLNDQPTVHYAYALISYDDGQLTPIRIEGIAYESKPDARIQVPGIQEEPPEPSSFLSLLATGAAGVFSWRKQRPTRVQSV